MKEIDLDGDGSSSAATGQLPRLAVRRACKKNLRTALGGVILGISLVPVASWASQPPCDLLPPAMAPSAPEREITALDLARLRDFGGMQFDTYPGPPAALSPDGRHVALQLRRGDPSSNRYCTGIVVKETVGTAPPRIVADGGEIIRLSFDKYGFSGLVSGAPVPSVLRWSPDGRRLAFTKAIGGLMQVFLVRPDGSGEAQLTRSPVSIDDFQWLPGGAAIVYASRPALLDEERRIDGEAPSGWRYDVRFWPIAGGRPHPPSSTPSRIDVIALADRTPRPALSAEGLVLAPDGTPGWPASATQVLPVGGGTDRAWLAPVDPSALFKPNVLHVSMNGRELPCPQSACTDVVGLWKRDPRTILFLRRQGVARSEMALLSWDLGKGAPRVLHTTIDPWLGCQLGPIELVCAAESDTAPRHVIGVDAGSGRVRTIYDPNPEFAAIRLRRPERMAWRNAFGIETFGDLVLPSDYRPGHPAPLIVVQYDSRGFLRGGTADEFPIQLFAAKGFAVLSFNRPPWYGLQGPPLDLFAFLKANQKDWSDRRSVQSSLEIVVERLIARGIADPARIGITGQSDGATTATFALVHSRLFKAVALSTCCEEATMMANLGPGFEDWYARTGYPRFNEDRRGFWKEGSLVPNLGDLPPVPLLIQAGEEEFRFALPTYAAAKNAGWPTEMYVFSGEGHVKLQPAHRLAVYERNLAWFQRWFKPREGASP
ncbi:Atxe2 family lasso peptide isopeptidase [Novosphingobium sp. BL-52-GroH]|uniref:Atxe2 family lasso peptide isopeptidase n=1 Tax=Novosphingobium sp. BL-52-GroH TaxID=3349877 RepID=UPI00384CDC05